MLEVSAASFDSGDQRHMPNITAFIFECRSHGRVISPRPTPFDISSPLRRCVTSTRGPPLVATSQFKMPTIIDAPLVRDYLPASRPPSALHFHDLFSDARANFLARYICALISSAAKRMRAMRRRGTRRSARRRASAEL